MRPDEQTRGFDAVGAQGESDAPTTKDNLGFGPYAEALAAFLAESPAPITVSIEGEWGSGKSSFMRKLEERLASEDALVVTFNPWHHEKPETLWAAFSTRLLHEAKAHPHAARRAWGDWTLRRYRKDRSILRAAAPWGAATAAAGLVLVLLRHGVSLPDALLAKLGAEQAALPDAAVGGTSLLAAGYGLYRLAANVKEAVADPVEKAIAHQAAATEAQPDFVASLQREIGDILRAYVGERRVYVMVDDLDRCSPQQAADTLLAINRMLDGAHPNLVFLLAMDREKVAAGFAVRHRDAFAFLGETIPPGETADARERRLRRSGMRYGHEFIEKFIQIPFRLPQPSARDTSAFFLSLAKPPQAPAPPLAARLARRVRVARERVLRRLRGRRAGSVTLVPADARAPAQDAAGAPPDARKEAVKEDVRRAGRDSARVGLLLERVAPYLDRNPRRMKQFLNLFRLRALIAAETDLFRPQDEGAEKGKVLTFPRLAKLVVLTLRRPDLMADVEDDPQLLLDLERALEGRPFTPASARFEAWADDAFVRDVLRLGVARTGEEGWRAEEGAPEDWTLSLAPVRRMLQTVPKVRTAARASEEEMATLAAARTVVPKAPPPSEESELWRMWDAVAPLHPSSATTVGALLEVLPEPLDALLQEMEPGRAMVSLVAPKRAFAMRFVLAQERDELLVEFRGPGVPVTFPAGLPGLRGGTATDGGWRAFLEPDPKLATAFTSAVLAWAGCAPGEEVLVALHVVETPRRRKPAKKKA